MYLFLSTVHGFYWVNPIQFIEQLCTMHKALDQAWWGLQKPAFKEFNILS